MKTSFPVLVVTLQQFRRSAKKQPNNRSMAAVARQMHRVVALKSLIELLLIAN